MTEFSEFKLENLRTLPCNCPVCCGSKPSDLDIEDLVKHNTSVLERVLSYLIQRMDELRNIVEAWVKFKPELTAMLRFADSYKPKMFPKFGRTTVFMNTSESFKRPEVELFFDRALRFYEPKGRVLLILPCSAKKPYSISRSHQKIKRVVKRGVEEIIVSSPLVVPRVFEFIYPAVKYDVPVTGNWSKDEVYFVSERLRAFIEKGDFDLIVAHVVGGYRDVVESCANELDLDVVWTAVGDVTSDESLRNLKKTLEGVEIEPFDLYKSIFEHTMRYQFEVTYSDVKIRGRYPNLEFYSEGKVARVDLNYGCLDVYQPLAEFLIEKKAYTVEIDDFVPKGTIFAVGVIKADERIRPNDVIVFYNEKIVGVGRALMSGEEMTECEGKAVEVKRVFNRLF